MNAKKIVWTRDDNKHGFNLDGCIGDLKLFSIVKCADPIIPYVLEVLIPFYSENYQRYDIESCKKEAQEILEQFLKAVIE